MADIPTPENLDALDQLLAGEADAETAREVDAAVHAIAQTGAALDTFSRDEDGLQVDALWSRVHDGLQAQPRQRRFWTLPRPGPLGLSWTGLEGSRLGPIPAAFASAGATAAIVVAIVLGVVLIGGGRAEARFFQRVAELEEISRAAVLDDVLTVAEVAEIEIRVAVVVQSLAEERQQLDDSPAEAVREALSTVTAVRTLLETSVDEQVTRPPPSETGSETDAASPERLRDFASTTGPALSEVVTAVERIVDDGSESEDGGTARGGGVEEEPEAEPEIDRVEPQREAPTDRGPDAQSSEPVRPVDGTDETSTDGAAADDRASDASAIDDGSEPVSEIPTREATTDTTQIRDVQESDALIDDSTADPAPTRTTDRTATDEPIWSTDPTASEIPTREATTDTTPIHDVQESDALIDDSSAEPVSDSETVCTERDSALCRTR